MKKRLIFIVIAASLIIAGGCGRKDIVNEAETANTLDQRTDELEGANSQTEEIDNQIEQADDQTEENAVDENISHTIKFEDDYKITMTIPEGMYDYIPDLEDAVSYNGALVANLKTLDDEQRIREYLEFKLKSSQDLFDGVQEEEISGYKCYYVMYEFTEENKRYEDEITYFVDCYIPLNDEVMLSLGGNMSDYDFDKILDIQDEENVDYVDCFKQIMMNIIDGMGEIEKL